MIRPIRVAATYGAKYTDIELYHSMIPLCTNELHEYFLGGGSLTFNFWNCEKYVINEIFTPYYLHHKLLKEDDAYIYELLKIVPDEKVFQNAKQVIDAYKKGYTGISDFELARSSHIVRTQSFNSTGSSFSCSASDIDYRYATLYHQSKIQQKYRHENYEIRNTDALNLLEELLVKKKSGTINPNMFLLLDPPYPMCTRNGSAYPNEPDDRWQEDFIAKLIQLSKGKIRVPMLVCTYWNPLYESLMHHGFHRILVKEKKKACQNKGAGVEKSLGYEIAYFNYEPTLRMQNMPHFHTLDITPREEWLSDKLLTAGAFEQLQNGDGNG